MKYSFSGHESFTCKALWLKKGYDFIKSNNDFNAPESVIKLGVGKNMVTAIRYWMRVFGLTQNDEVNELADYLLDTVKGKDPYIEDLGTIWLLHFMLVRQCEATLYNWIFQRFQRERKVFDRQQIANFVYRCLVEDGKQSLFNENTVKTDVNVFVQNYVLPQNTKSFDDYNSLLIDLELINAVDSKNYQFNIEGKRPIPWQIFLYSVIIEKGKDNTVSYDTLQSIGLVFCMNDIEVIEMCRTIEENCPDVIRYSDIAGIKQIQFMTNLTGKNVLDKYYE